MQQPQDLSSSSLTSEVSSSEQTTSDETTSTDTSESMSVSASDTSSSDDSSASDDFTTSSEEEDTSEESEMSADPVTKSGEDATPAKPFAAAADKAVSSEPISAKSSNDVSKNTAIAIVKSTHERQSTPSAIGDHKSVDAPSSDSSPTSSSQNLSDDTAKSHPQLPPELAGGWGEEPEPAPWEWQHMPFDYMGILEEQRRTVFWEFRETRDGKGEWVLPNYQGSSPTANCFDLSRFDFQGGETCLAWDECGQGTCWEVC